MATNWEVYQPTQWVPTLPITQDRMMKIENGIADNRDDVKSLLGGLNTANSQINEKADKTYVDNSIILLSNRIDNNNSERAWNALTGAGVIYDDNTNHFTTSLDDILGLIRTSVTNVDSRVSNEVSAIKAIFGTKLVSNVPTTAYDSNHTVYADIEYLKDIIGRDNNGNLLFSYTDGDVSNTIYNLKLQISNAQGNYATLAARLSAMTSNISTITDTANNAWSQVNGALRQDHPGDTLAQRFAEIETATSGKINTNVIENNLETLDSTIDHVLDARQGRVIRDLLYKVGDTAFTTTNTVASRIKGVADKVEVLENVIGNAAQAGFSDQHTISNTAKEIDDAHRSGLIDSNTNEAIQDTLDNRFDDIEERLDLIDDLSTGELHNLDARLDTIEGELRDARIEIGTDTNSGDPIMSTLDQRLDVIDTTAAGIRADLNTIAGELAMMDNGALVTTNTRVDTLENDLRTMAVELNMLDGTSIVDTNSRIDQLANAISHTASGADVGGLTERIGMLESGLDSAETNIIDLDTRLDAIDGGEALVGGQTLISRVSTLEGKDTIIVNKPNNGSNYTNDVPNLANPSADADYLIADDENKYFYWRYINNQWELISGAGGGSGTSSALILTTLPPTNEADVNVDYYIGTNATGYIHYRYINNEYQMILPKGIINNLGLTLNGGLVASEIGSETNKLADFVALKEVTMVENKESEAEDAPTESYTITFTDTNGDTYPLTLAAGGGGSASLSTAILNRIGSGNLTTIVGEHCTINFTYYATDNSGDPLATASTATWYVNRAQIATSEVYVNNPNDNTDYNSFDITQYLNVGDNNITLIVTSTIDDKTVTRNKNWVVDVKNFALTWDYDESMVQTDSTIDFSCTPSGADITKTLHLKVNETEQTRTVTTSGIPITMSLNNTFAHGVYTAEMWMTAMINGEPKETAHIFHDFIVVVTGNDTPIIAATLPTNTVDQYNTITIPFVVYTPNTNTSTVVLAVDGAVQDTRTVGRTKEQWNYTPLTDGEKVLTITSGITTKTLNLTVDSININNEEIGGYTFKLKASELPSNNALKAWYYDTQNQANTKLQFSNNFDWINGGIHTETDENGQLRQFIRVKSGTTMTIPYKMFATDPRVNGSNFKIIFKTENCRDYDATILTTMADDIGIQLNAHNAIFKSTTTQISTQYSEEEYTELEFEVYKALTPNGTDATNKYIMAWVDGVMTTARAYGGNFVQTNQANIVIGSTDCDICVYLIKYYPMVLSRDDHVTNFIADAPNAVEMINRYNRNDILDESGEIDYNKLARANKDCRVWLYDIDRMTKAKDDPILVHRFQQIWENGGPEFQLVGTNAKLKIQGTSSFNYRFGAANTDIDFGKKKAPDATLVDGNNTNLLDDSLEYKGFKIRENSLPITYSNTKVNFASCEQVNNMCNAEWYQRYQPFPSLSARDCMEFAMGVQFIKDRRNNEPADGITLFTEKENWNSEKYYMYSVANMGTSKKNTHIFHSDDEVCIEIKENTTDAQKMKSFDSNWVLPDNTGNYEIRYPDIDVSDFSQELKDGWARFVTWMSTNDPNQATGNAIEEVTFEPYTFKGHNREVTEVQGRHFAQVLRGVTVSQYAGTYDHDTFEYRMAKMLSECEDYMAMDSVIYHFCFIERHTMVDNVAKNTFWSSIKEVGGPNDEEGYWIWDLSKNYDNDTSDGNNNNGLLVFDYGNEANDTRDGTPVFNGYDTVWFVFASNLYEACRAMFTNREAIGAWDSTAYHNYLTGEQKKVPERVWNECYWYDYLRTYENNIETAWINFLDGGQKTHQRKHYETYEEIYDSSKYRGSFSHNQSITLRGEAIDYQTLGLPAQESKFEITMFNKCYLTIWIGTNYQTIKCQKGVPVTLHFYKNNDPNQGYMSLANSVIDIDSGSMVQTIGDLSRIYPSSGQFSFAKRLRSLQIGSDTEGYYNPNMNTNSVLTFNNKMLEYLYVQNLPQATYNLDLTGCPELKYLNASGSGFTGYVFANGGMLSTAYINNPNSLVMRNLSYLTNENFHLTSPTSVTSLRLESCSLFNNYTFINQLTNLSTLRLTDIDWTLSTGDLLDRLLGIQGIDESGFTIAQSYLAGNVELTGTVYEGIYNAYTAAWSPDLIIDRSHATEFIAQHLVRYLDEDGTELYRQYINASTNLTDPYNLLDSIPTKDPDIRYTYTFGSLDFTDTYIPFSGWRLENDSDSIYNTYGASPSISVNGTMTVYAVYGTRDQQYRVRWIARNTVVATSSLQNYGSGYDLIAPTIKEVQAVTNTYTFSAMGDICSYTIMTGWEKLPTNIAPTEVGGTYDIYATWLERTNVNYITVLTSDDYSVEEKLLVLKQMSNARTNSTYAFSIRDIFPVTLGHYGTKPGIALLSNPTRFNGAITTINEYTPFAATKSFTMAIDYRFENVSNSVANQAVLLSCYSNANESTQGFKLFYNPQSSSPVPQISFGSTAGVNPENQIRTIGNKITNRNMVVIRHCAGESLLYVYSGANASGLKAEYSSDFRQAIEWSSISSDAKIILGGTNINTDTSMMNATGMLYSVYYWEEDLGEGECLQLANWCHETINFAVSDFKEAATSDHSALNSTLTSSIILHTLNASEMGNTVQPQLDRSNMPTNIGWDPSTLKDFYNNRVYQALPIKLQSIITPVNIPFNKAVYNTNEGAYQINSTAYSTQDYVFAPSCIEMGEGSGITTTAHSIEATGQISWHKASNITVKSYSNGNLTTIAGNANYTNLRFPYQYNRVNSDITIYTNYPYTGTSFYRWALSKSITLNSGDILITDGDNPVAYIYVTAQEVAQGAPYVDPTLGFLTDTSGGWIEAKTWQTRSVPDSIFGSQNMCKFVYVNSLGNLLSGNVREHGIVYSIGL